MSVEWVENRIEIKEGINHSTLNLTIRRKGQLKSKFGETGVTILHYENPL